MVKTISEGLQPNLPIPGVVSVPSAEVETNIGPDGKLIRKKRERLVGGGMSKNIGTEGTEAAKRILSQDPKVWTEREK
jgi:hypothetical protein